MADVRKRRYRLGSRVPRPAAREPASHLLLRHSVVAGPGLEGPVDRQRGLFDVVAKLPHSKRFWSALKVFYYILFTLALATVGLYLWENRFSLDAVWHAPPYLWLTPALIYLGLLIVRSLTFDVLARVYGVRVPLFDSLGLTASGALSNYAVPGNMSLPLRSLYLHRVLGLHYRDFLPLAAASFVFSTGLYGILAGIVSLINGAVPTSAYGLAMLMFGGGGLAVVLAMSLPYHSLPLVGHSIEGLLAGWRLLYRSRTLFGQWLGLEILRAPLEVAFLYSIFYLLAIDLTLAQTTIIVLAKDCSIFLRITPGGFGIAEGVQVFFALQFGADPARVLLAAILGRAMEVVCLALVSSVLVRRLARRLAGNQAPEMNASAPPIQP
jgi:uncharacterized membrane protein YbhN (UPF0104 family)